MGVRVAINGFGRMGRLALRAAWAADYGIGQKKISLDDFEIVHINEPNCDAALSAHLLEFDSVHGRWTFPVSGGKEKILIGDRQLGYSQGKTLKEIDWRRRGIDVVIECSGKYKSVDQLAPYFEAGVRKVVVSAPIKKDVANIVVGVNDHQFDFSQHQIVTAASCTTNCLAPVVQVIHQTFGIKHGMITTIHNVTNTQTVIDKPAKDYRRARSALLNLIPTTTGSATAIGLIFPELQGRLDGIAIRVPLLNASITDCVFEVDTPTTKDKVNAAFSEAAERSLRGIMAVETRPLVSTDYRGNTHSSIIDALSTMVTNGTQVKIIAWYDNEMGYAHRLHELARKVASTLNGAPTQPNSKQLAAEQTM